MRKFISAQNSDHISWLIENGCSPKLLMETYIPGSSHRLLNTIKRFDIKLNRNELHSLISKAVDPSSIKSLEVLLENAPPVDEHYMEHVCKSIEVGSIEALKLLVKHGVSIFNENLGLRGYIFIQAFKANRPEMVAYLLTQHPFSKEAFSHDGDEYEYNSDTVKRCRLGNLANALKEINSNITGAVEDKSGIPSLGASDEGLTTKMGQFSLPEKVSTNNVNSANITCLMLIEAGPDGVDILNDQLCQYLFNTGQEKKLFDIPKTLDDKPVDYRNKLKEVVREAHSKNN